MFHILFRIVKQNVEHIVFWRQAWNLRCFSKLRRAIALNLQPCDRLDPG
jgi:hypothetical protein